MQREAAMTCLDAARMSMIELILALQSSFAPSITEAKEYARTQLTDSTFESLWLGLRPSEALELLGDLRVYLVIPTSHVHGDGPQATKQTQIASEIQSLRESCIRSLREICRDSVLVSDFYMLLSFILETEGNLPRATEYAGRALLIRMRSSAALTERAGESHLRLGALYLRQRAFDDSSRELIAARAVYAKVMGSSSLEVATCDLLAGRLEAEQYAYSRAYACYLRAWRVRWSLLGPTNPLTQSADQCVHSVRAGSGGGRLISTLELRARISELGWMNHSVPATGSGAGTGIENRATSVEWSIVRSVSRLHEDAVLTMEQLAGLVASSVRFFRTALSALSAEDDRDTRSEINEEQLVLSLLVPTSPETLFAATTSSFGPFANASGLGTGTLGSTTGGGVSFSPQISSLKRLRRLRSGEALLASKSYGASAPLPPIVETDNASTVTEAATEKSPPEQMLEAEVEVPVTVNSEPPPSQETLVIDVPTSIKDSSEIDPTNKLPNVEESSVPPTVVDPIISNPQVSIENSTENTNKGSIIDRRTLRKIPLNSPLLREPAADIATVIRDKQSFQVVRQRDGALLLAKKTTIPEIRSLFRSRVIAMSLVAYYALGNSVKSTNQSKSLLDDVGKELPTGDTNDVNMETEGDITDGDSKSAAKLALGALFGKKNGENNSVSSDVSSENLNDIGICFIPRPPPLPTCWPPIPYTGRNEQSDEGTPAASNSAVALASPRARLKQVYLTPLSTPIESTFWVESADELIPPSELFHDLEEAFALKAPQSRQSIPTQVNAKAFGTVLDSLTKAGKAKAAAPSCLDAGRAQNINIMLAKFGRTPLSTIAESISAVDLQLGSQASSALQEFIPTDEEVTRVTQFVDKQWQEAISSGTIKSSNATPPKSSDGKPVAWLEEKQLNELKIGRAEQYIYLLGGRIPNLSTRLAVINSAINGKETQAVIISSCEALLNACAEVSGSERLKFLLRTAAALHNLLVQRGGAVGGGSNNTSGSGGGTVTSIPLTGWGRLSQLKLHSGHTAQQYIVDRLFDSLPESLLVGRDFTVIGEARMVQLNRLNAEVKKLEEAVRITEELLSSEQSKLSSSTENGEANTSITSRAVASLISCLNDLKKAALETRERLELAITEFERVTAYYGEVSSDPESFFGEITGICRAVAQATTQAEVTAKRRKKAREQKAAISPPSESRTEQQPVQKALPKLDLSSVVTAAMLKAANPSA